MKIILLFFSVCSNIFAIQYGNINDYNDPLYTRQSSCDDNDPSCFPTQNNFINEYLKNVPDNLKIKLLNQNIKKHSYKKIELKLDEQNQIKRFGLYLKENLLQNQKILNFNTKKVIKNKQINYSLFFLNSLQVQSRKYILNFYQINSNSDSYYDKNQLFILNLFYHLTRIDISFLKNDLIGLPVDEISPLFTMTLYELHLFQKDQFLRQKMIEHFQGVRKAHNHLKSNLNRQLNQEQFSLYFQVKQ